MANDDVGAARVNTSNLLDFRALKPQDGVLIFHPEVELDVESLAAFMRAGGRVLLFDDFGEGDALLRHFGIEKVAPPRRPVESLRGQAVFAIAEAASAHPVVQEVSKIVTNHPMALRHPELTPLLKIRAVGEPDALLAQAGVVGQGRFLAVADPSILMNAMLRYPGNSAFCRAILRYAVENDGESKRGGQLIIVSGAFEQVGSYGDQGGIEQDIAARLRGMREAIEKVRKEGLSPNTAYLLSLALAFCVMAWVASRTGRLHRATAPRFTRPLPLLAQGGVAGHAALLSAGHTPRALAILELKSALEEDLAVLLGLEHVPSHEVLLKTVAQGGMFRGEQIQSLRELLLRMAKIETIVLSKRMDAMDRIRDREVVEIAKRIRALLASAHRAAKDNAT